jgi:hypothetical protein
VPAWVEFWTNTLITGPKVFDGIIQIV